MSEWLPKPKGMHWKTYYRLKRKVDHGNDVCVLCRGYKTIQYGILEHN